MEKQDARRLKLTEQYELRKQVISAWQQGQTRVRISEDVGLSYPAVCKIVKRYRVNETKDMSALAPARRGRRAGEDRVLSEQQEALIQGLICKTRPEQLKMEFVLWNRTAVMRLIERECAIKLTERGVSIYLNRWGFTLQRPIKKLIEQRPDESKRWLIDEYLEIKKRAKTEGGEIHWGDISALVRTDVRGRNETHTNCTVADTRQERSIVATVTNRGKMRWMIINVAINSDTIIDFFEFLIKGSNRKVFLILDRQRAYRSKSLKAWAKNHKDTIALFNLPRKTDREKAIADIDSQVKAMNITWPDRPS